MKESSRRGRRGFNMRPIDILAMAVTLIAAALLLLAYRAGGINPNEHPLFALTALTAPILFTLNIAAALYWIIRWKWPVAIPALCLLLGIGNIWLFIKPSLGKAVTFEPDRNAITVASYNVHGFRYPDNKPNMARSLEFVSAFSPDVICMQEYQIPPQTPQDEAERVLPAFRYKRIEHGLAVFSRFPIVNSGGVHFPDSRNAMIWADVVVRRGDTLRIFNNHLQSTAISADDHDFLTQNIGIGEETERKIRSIASKLVRNYKARARQVDSIAPVIHSSGYPRIVCGDFNDTPMSYAYKTMRGDMKDAFVEKGHGVSGTYRGFFNLLRIDYILHSGELAAVGYTVPTSVWSDHNPVITSVVLKR